jgi:hypothetical protein
MVYRLYGLNEPEIEVVEGVFAAADRDPGVD